MRIYNSGLLLLLGMVFTLSLQANIGPTRQGQPVDTPSDQVNFRGDCNNAVTQIDQQVNNVRARLTTGGDVWWDGNDGRYVVPKPPPGVPEVSSIFAGAVWIGGLDPGGNLKLAAQAYGRASGNFDFYPGPLFEGNPADPLNDPRRGTVGQDTCTQWDDFFVVKGRNVDSHVANWARAVEEGKTFLDPSDIPEDVLGWPAKGNPFFEEIHQFRLPETVQGLAGFWDQPPYDGLYRPDEGDYPIIEIRGCLDEEPKSAPDEMIYWVYNDAGNAHRESGSENILQMEIQVQAFSYVSNDDINNMTFQRYKLINRSIETLDSTFFAMWVDPDLGCYTDDYVGCDVGRSLAYVYNADQLDGTNGCTCDQGVNTYCDEVPILGVDYFRGPLAPIYDSIVTDSIVDTKELGMSSFTYYNNASIGGPPPGTTDPQTPQEYYNYLSGKWRDGSPFTFGGDAYQTGGAVTPYAFGDAPNESGGWSMCSEELSQGDRRTLQASGPFTLLQGAINELIVGVVWVPDQVYPCPSITRLQKADDIAQSLFDNCFNITLGPDAPDIDWVELDREIVAVFSNSELTSNNVNEEYEEVGLGIPQGQDTLYRFEGYKLYQLSGPSVSLVNRDDPAKVRLVYQVDKINGIEKIFNWEGLNQVDNQTPTAEIYYVPALQVNGENKGIRRSFSIKEDQFAEGDRSLVNHRKYYFAAVAYAYNNYKEFDPNGEGDLGQQTPYLEGVRNIGDGDNPFHTVIPRKILDRQLQSAYGDGPTITRIDGVGTGANFLDISDATRQEIEKTILDDDPDSFSKKVSYKGGFGPIDVSIFNPLDVLNGEYELTFTDDDMGNDELDAPIYWTLRSLTDAMAPVITADKSIEDINEQIIREYGFSVTIAQVEEPGSSPFENEANGAIGYTEEYLNPDASPWLSGIVDDQIIATGNPLFNGVFNYMATSNSTDVDYDKDPNQSLSKMSTGTGVFVPYYLCDWRSSLTGLPYITPAWMNSGSQNNIVRNRTSLADLNNVDIVFTSNKDLWSRCVIVETANPMYQEVINATPEGDYIEGDAKMFDLRARNSVSKEAGPDGMPLPDTNPLAGEEKGMGWFPGYAIDVETGQRLNIFFGENSAYNDSMPGLSFPVGDDMMFNPSSEVFFAPVTGTGGTILNLSAGGQHFVYVTNQPYDRCAKPLDRFDGNGIKKIAALEDVTWAGFIMLPQGKEMESYADGLIPDDVIVKIRVNNAYQVETGTGEFNGYPTYRFTLEGKEALPLDEIAMDVSLQSINVIPNPYYGFSEYEDSQFENIVKISNLPAICTISIYSLDGKFVRTYERNETGRQSNSPNRSVERAQITPDLEWDMKNFRGIPIASGVYLIHVSAPGLGERTLKWFGINRQFDPSGL